MHTTQPTKSQKSKREEWNGGIPKLTPSLFLDYKRFSTRLHRLRRARVGRRWHDCGSGERPELVRGLDGLELSSRAQPTRQPGQHHTCVASAACPAPAPLPAHSSAPLRSFPLARSPSVRATNNLQAVRRRRCDGTPAHIVFAAVCCSCCCCCCCWCCCCADERPWSQGSDRRHQPDCCSHQRGGIRAILRAGAGGHQGGRGWHWIRPRIKPSSGYATPQARNRSAQRAPQLSNHSPVAALLALPLVSAALCVLTLLLLYRCVACCCLQLRPPSEQVRGCRCNKVCTHSARAAAAAAVLSYIASPSPSLPLFRPAGLLVVLCVFSLLSLSLSLSVLPLSPCAESSLCLLLQQVRTLRLHSSLRSAHDHGPSLFRLLRGR